MKPLKYYGFSIFASELIKDSENRKYAYLVTKLTSKFTHKNHEKDSLGNQFFFPKNNNNYAAYHYIPSEPYEFYDFQVEIGGEQLDDFMSNADINSAFGFVVSQAAKDVLDQFKLPGHRYFPLKVVFKKKKTDYYFLLLAKGKQGINYEQSVFVDRWQKEQIIPVKSYKDLLKFHPANGANPAVYGKKAIEEQQIVFEERLDIYTVVTRAQHFFYFSERLKKALEEMDSSGVLFHEQDKLDFFLQEKA